MLRRFSRVSAGEERKQKGHKPQKSVGVNSYVFVTYAFLAYVLPSR